jgi:transcriptional regulator with XRE-family HTH domain
VVFLWSKAMQSEELKFNKELGALIRATRVRFGMSQKDIANKIGVTHQQIQKYESGQNAIPSYRLHKISAILETSFVMDGYPKSDYRILDKSQIDFLLSKAHEALINLETQLLK